ncbi:MAG: hypothetical protein R3C25_03675 [Hyphomonadaceae bacterium]
MRSSFGWRRALLAGGALAAVLSLAETAAGQELQEIAPASAFEAAEAATALSAGDVDLIDPQTVMRRASVSIREDAARRFAEPQPTSDAVGPRRVEVEVAAGEENLGVSFAQRATLGGGDGGMNRQGQGSELRVGRGLVRARNAGDGGASTYVFVASEDEALTWQPGSRNEFGGQGASLALQDRVEVGDLSAGVTYERDGIQASLAYVERQQSTVVGNQGFSQDERFAGVTLTMRR